MNVIIEIPEERAAIYQGLAEARGLTMERWLLELADQNAPIPSISHLQRANPKEWARQFRAWAEAHDRGTPVLSAEAMSRESIYPDRT
jgi:argininosuccinate lyase